MQKGVFPLVEHGLSVSFENKKNVRTARQLSWQHSETRRQTSNVFHVFPEGKSQTRRVPSKETPIAKTMAQCE
jgi:hypothetical protein